MVLRRDPIHRRVTYWSCANTERARTFGQAARLDRRRPHVPFGSPRSPTARDRGETARGMWASRTTTRPRPKRRPRQVLEAATSRGALRRATCLVRLQFLLTHARGALGAREKYARARLEDPTSESDALPCRRVFALLQAGQPSWARRRPLLASAAASPSCGCWPATRRRAGRRLTVYTR